MKLGYIRVKRGVDPFCYEKFAKILMAQGATGIYLDIGGCSGDAYMKTIPDGSTLYLISLDHLGRHMEAVRRLVSDLRDRNITVYCAPFDVPVIPECIYSPFSDEEVVAKMRATIEQHRKDRAERRKNRK